MAVERYLCFRVLRTYIWNYNAENRTREVTLRSLIPSTSPYMVGTLVDMHLSPILLCSYYKYTISYCIELYY